MTQSEIYVIVSIHACWSSTEHDESTRHRSIDARLPCYRCARPCRRRGASRPRRRPPADLPATRSTRRPLDNGLTVLSVPFDSPGIIAYYTVVRTGSRNEVEKGLSGFAHFFEHMMFRGTEKYPQEKYNDVLKSLGADSNAFTNDDWTCYHMTIPASALATAVEIEADRFQNLKYDEPSFQKEARAVLGEYNKSASSPFLKLDEAMQDTAYTTHTYKHTTIGFLADIKDMPNQYAYSKVFFDRWYRPENCTIVVTGDVKHDELVSLVSSHYGAWERGKASVEIPAEPPQTEPRSAHLTWPVPTLPTLYLGYHIPAADPSNPDVGRPRGPRAGRLRRDQPALPRAGAQGAEGRDAHGRGRAQARSRASSRSSPGSGSPRTCPCVRKRIAEALAEAAKTPDRRGPARRDQVAPPLRVRRLAPQRRRRGRHGRRVDRARPAGPTRSTSSSRPTSGSPPPTSSASPRRYFSPDQRDGDHPRDGEEEMTTTHRLATRS